MSSLRALSSRRASRRLATRLAFGCAAAAALACTRGGERARAPAADFLLSAGDSTYWVTSAAGSGTMHVRASSMLLARVGGRLYEVYAADDDRSFYDAVFTTQRVYRRDLLSGDSAAVWDDPTVGRLARAYAAANPNDTPLAPDEDASENPATVATTEVSLIDVHGPYLTVESRGDFDVAGRRHRHVARRSVVDLRTGRRVSLVDLVGDSAARAAIGVGRTRLVAAADSVRALAAAADAQDLDASDVAARALRSLPTLRFDPASFGLGDVDRALAVVFVVPGTDPDGRAVTLPLPPVAVAGPAPRWWNGEARAALPTFTADSSEARWPIAGGTHEVVARHTADRDAAFVTVRASRRPNRFAARRGRGGGPAVRVPAPVRQLVALDRPPLPADSRRALARAFNESTLYGDEAMTAAFERGAPGAPGARRPRPSAHR